jgi:hypothetical protein
MTSSQQMVRKLLKATASAAPEEEVSKKSKRKRHKDKTALDEQQPAVTEQDVLAWHTQTLLVTDRKMAATGSKHSNAAAFGKSLQKLERKIEMEQNKRLKTVSQQGAGAARTSASSRALQTNEPTFDKKRHEQEREQKKLHKLAKALKTMGKMGKKKPGSSIFG